jgi:hypothetical protein
MDCRHIQRGQRHASAVTGEGSVTVQTPVIGTLADLIFATVEHSCLALSEVAPSEEVRSLEVRWIFPGQLETAVAGWFGRFPARTESREDTYLLDPRLRGLSVKIRGGRALEVKVYRGSPGILEVAGRARGRMQSWQKWSFPFSPLHAGSGGPAAGGRYARSGASVGSCWPAGRSWRTPPG